MTQRENSCMSDVTQDYFSSFHDDIFSCSASYVGGETRVSFILSFFPPFFWFLFKVQHQRQKHNYMRSRLHTTIMSPRAAVAEEERRGWMVCWPEQRPVCTDSSCCTQKASILTDLGCLLCGS
jgi:hypothetical protein